MPPTRSRQRAAPRPALSQAAIARALGVSQATVSYVLNNSGRVNPRTRERIQRMVRQSHYRPNANARSLRAAHSQLVGVTCGSPTDSYEARLLDALGTELDRQGYQMMFHGCRGTVGQMWDQAVKFVDHRVCGIIFQTPHPQLYAQMRDAFPNVPMVAIGGTRSDAVAVGCDYAKAGERIGKHLIAQGRRRIGLNLTPNEWDSGLRYRSTRLKQVLKEAGLPDPVEIVIEGEHYQTHLAEYGRVAAEALLREHPDLDAMVFTCDDIAVGAIAWLTQNGKRVPEDVAVVGFNDVALAQTGLVPLTTIHQPVEEYARLAVEMLLKQLDKPGALKPTARLVDCPLIVRQSSDPGWRPDTATGRAPEPVVHVGNPTLPQAHAQTISKTTAQAGPSQED